MARKVKSKQMLRRQIANLLFPSFDGVGLALTNVFFHLARHPDVYQKLRKEVLHINLTDLTFEQLKSITLLNSIVKEALRLNPTIGINARVAAEDTTIPRGGGANGENPVFIVKGEVIFTHYYSLLRRKDLFGSEPDEFQPERWQDLKPTPGPLHPLEEDRESVQVNSLFLRRLPLSPWHSSKSFKRSLTVILCSSISSKSISLSVAKMEYTWP